MEHLCQEEFKKKNDIHAGRSLFTMQIVSNFKENNI